MAALVFIHTDVRMPLQKAGRERDAHPSIGCPAHHRPATRPAIPCGRQKPACGLPRLSSGCPQDRQYAFLSLSRAKKRFFRYPRFAVTGYEKLKSNRFLDVFSYFPLHIPVRCQKQAAPNPSVLSASCQLRAPQNLLCAPYLLPAISSLPPAHPVFMPKKRRRFLSRLLSLPHFSAHKTPLTAVPFGGIPPKGTFRIGGSAPFGFSKFLVCHTLAAGSVPAQIFPIKRCADLPLNREHYAALRDLCIGQSIQDNRRIFYSVLSFFHAGTGKEQLLFHFFHSFN